MWYSGTHFAHQEAMAGRPRSRMFRLLGWKMKSVVRFVTSQNRKFRRWGRYSPILRAIMSREAMARGYRSLSSSEVMRWWKKPTRKSVAPEQDYEFKTVLGDPCPAWKSWLRARRKIRCLEDKPPKKRTSWLPDPRHRWPQGWC